MKRKIALFLCSVLCLTSTMSVCAANDVTSAGEGSVPLSFSKDSTFTVTLPEAISGGSNTSVDFDYSVEGDIAADKTITVNVEDSDAGADGIQLALSDVSGNTKNANISIPKTDFAYNEITAKNTQTGSVSVDNLTAGSWSGVAKFVIGMSEHEHNYVETTVREVTCTSNGELLYECTCGDSYTKTVLAHHIDANGDNICDMCSEDVSSGVYDVDGNCVASWSELVNDYGLNISKSYGDSMTPKTTTSSLFYILSNNSEFADVTKVIVDDSVTSIGSYSFANCTSLSSVVIQGSVTAIPANAFRGCTSLLSIVIPDGVTTIGDFAFQSCGLTSLVLPNSVETINMFAFTGCSSLDLTVPDSVTNIGTNAFGGVSHITYHGSSTGSPWGANSIN